MDEIEALLDQMFSGQERMSRDEIYTRAVGADLTGPALTTLDLLPEGEYSEDEVVTALAELTQEPDPGDRAEPGISAVDLSDDDLIRELARLHRTRHETFLHGSSQALVRHTERLGELESEYLDRFPTRDVDSDRLRAGARERA